ncbi:hypothetical protein D3C86_1873350 [compost metagenome]
MQPARVQLPGALEHEDGDQRGRQAADAETAHHLPLHVAMGAVRDGAEALGDGGKREVGTHRRGRREAEQQGQQRGHERAPAYPGQADQDTYHQTGSGVRKGHSGGLDNAFPITFTLRRGSGWARTQYGQAVI